MIAFDTNLLVYAHNTRDPAHPAALGWDLAGQPSFPRRRIIDARLAFTLRHHGVTEFATANVRDFRDFGFQRVWDPTVQSS